MIPFIRGYPGGHKQVEQVERPPDIDLLAARFIACGGRYLIAKYSDDDVRMMAVVAAPDGELYPVAKSVTPDGPLLPGAIDNLVRESVKLLVTVQ